MSTEDILAAIKQLVSKQLPNAKVYLYGSRASGVATYESDYDILIIEPSEVTTSKKWSIRETLFDFGIDHSICISPLLVNENLWATHPSYFSLKWSITNNPVLV